MLTCSRCHKDISLLGRLSYNSQTGRCGQCQKDVHQILNHFRGEFLKACQGRTITDAAWEGLKLLLSKYQIDFDEGLTFIRGDALHFIERVLVFAFSDGIIEEHEDREIRRLINLLGIPRNLAADILSRLEYLKRISDIRLGKLRPIQPTIHMDAGEICYMETEAVYHKVNARSITYVQGRLVATNKRLHFLSQTGGAEVPWKRVMRVERQGNGIYLELSTKKANGHYDVPDPLMTEAMVDVLVRIDKRQLVMPSDAGSRHIPQDVKQTVWQRDQGKCVQCSATTYLEFDHIIPFSKGGASSVNNVQLLCRRCNLAKRDRI
jgi:hypothetical protein